MKRAKGFTLLEVLIAVLLLAIGLLGLAKLQTLGLHANHSANLRTQATLLAYDLIERIRANPAGFNNGDYNNATPDDHDCVWDGNAPNTCTPQEMAEHDVWAWNATVSQQLPQGVGVVCLDATPNDGEDTDGNGVVEASEYACDNSGSLYVVKLWWVDEFDNAGDPVIKRFVTAFEP